MPDLWMPGATRLDIGDHAPTDGGEPRAVAHITWDRTATALRPLDLVPYETLATYFGRNPDGKPKAPTVLWDPFEGRFTQFLPATSRAKALADLAGGTRTNRTGDVCLQIEALFFPYCRVGGRVYPRLVDTPCEGWDELLAWIRSWGVPDDWPMGRPTDFTPRRSEQVWRTRGGWYAHGHVPENTHTDPGSWPDFSRATTPPRDPEDDDMSILGGELHPGFDPVGNLIIPPSVPDGRRMFVNIGADLGRVRGRVDAFVAGQGWRFLGEFTVDQKTDLAFYRLLPGTRKVNIKRLPGDGIRPDTPASWNIETIV